jgi:peptidoglycan/LPS O-acetylase OafA/YrhL
MSEAPTIRDKKFSHFYRPELDALRFFAFLGVFTFHVDYLQRFR